MLFRSLQVIPQSPLPGTQRPYEYQDNTSITSTNYHGDNDGSVEVEVFNPDKVKSNVYDVVFLGSGASKKWSLINNTDTTNPITLLSNELDFGGSPFHLMFDGFDVKVFDAPSAGLRNAQLTAPTNAAIFQTVDPSGQFQLFNDGTQLDDFTTSLTGLDAKYELRFTDNGSIARVKMSVEDTVGVWKRVPFEAWMVDSAGVNINRQVFVAYYDLNGDGIWNSTSNPFHGDYRMFDSIIGISKYIYRDTTHPTLQGVAGTLTKRGMLKAVNQRIKHLVFTDVNGEIGRAHV